MIFNFAILDSRFLILDSPFSILFPGPRSQVPSPRPSRLTKNINLFYKQSEVQFDDNSVKILGQKEPIPFFEYHDRQQYDEVIDD